jgi:glycosyltransferase involved in cell wall biosynthesis
MLSIIIPSRDARFLQKTIDDLIAKAEGEIEIIVVLDGYWPNPIIKDSPKVIVAHQGTVHNHKGMRDGINAGVRLARGEYIMKIDEHCMLDQGYDLKLIADCEDNWVVIPRRYRLDPEKWEIIHDGRPPIDYMYIEYPYLKPLDITQGLHGNEWRQRYYDRKDIMIDDTPSTQGSCYFMKKSWWDKMGEMESENYGTFTHEAQEITIKTWLMGGRVVVNKKTWYAHLHKGRKYGTGYGFSTDQWKRHSESMEKGRLYCINYWLYTTDYQYDWDWFVNKFPDMPGWTPDWKERCEKDRVNDYSTLNYKDSEWLEGLRK